MSNDTHAYIGTRPCGCTVAVCVDMVDTPKTTAKGVSEMIRNGYAVTRHPLTELHDGTIKLQHCEHQ
jgi:hypothetical protein